MSNPIRVRIRGEESVREWWMRAKGEFDLTHGELAKEVAKFVLDREQEFRKHLETETRSSASGERRKR